MSKNKVWFRGETGVNIMLYGDDKESWWISYNSSSIKTFGKRSSFLSDLSNETDNETAIVSRHGYHILNGDWREEYENIIDDGLEACLRFYASKPDYHSSWTDELPSQLKPTTKKSIAKSIRSH